MALLEQDRKEAGSKLESVPDHSELMRLQGEVKALKRLIDNLKAARTVVNERYRN